MEEIITIINNVGFPIFTCIYLVKNNEKLANSISDLNVTLKGFETRLQIMEERTNNKNE